MEFKQVREVTYSPLIAIRGSEKMLVDARSPHKWDSVEVVGIRSRNTGSLGETVEVNLCAR